MEGVGVPAGNAVISLSGEIDMASAAKVSSALAPAVGAAGPVIIDVSGVTFMDSTGIHALLEAAHALRRGGCLIIHGARGSVVRVLDVCQLAAVQPNIHIVGCAALTAA